MDDATASDNCGEVTIEVSGETTADARHYTIVRTFLPPTTPETALPADHHGPGHQLWSSPSSLPTTPECSDEMPMDDAGVGQLR